MEPTPHNLTYDQQQDVESHAPYLRVWMALLLLTLMEYFYAMALHDHFFVLVLGLMAMAVAKAGLVAWYFMHLKFEGNWVYLLIAPACAMATILVVALYPDIGLRHPADEEFEEGMPVVSAPAEPGSVASATRLARQEASVPSL